MDSRKILDLYSKTGLVVMDEVGKTSFDSFDSFKPQEIDVVNETSKNVLPFFSDKAPKELVKHWIAKACDKVGKENFVYKGAFTNQERCLKHLLWYTTIIHEVTVQCCYHRREQHKLPKIQKQFEKKRDRIVAKMVADRLNPSYKKLNFINKK